MRINYWRSADDRVELADISVSCAKKHYKTYKPSCGQLCMFLKVVFRKDRKAGEHKMCPHHFCTRLKTPLEKSVSGGTIRNENCDFWKGFDGYGEYWESGEPLPSVIREEEREGAKW